MPWLVDSLRGTYIWREARRGAFLEAAMTTILIIVLLVVLLGGGGFYGYRRW
jgi:hypothetical protein